MYVAAPIYTRMRCNSPGVRGRGSGIGSALQRHDSPHPRPAPCPTSLRAGTARQGRGGCPRSQGLGPCPAPARKRGALSHCNAMIPLTPGLWAVPLSRTQERGFIAVQRHENHDLTRMSLHQSTQGCGATAQGSGVGGQGSEAHCTAMIALTPVCPLPNVPASGDSPSGQG
jgi:hypothetical protein